MLQRFWQFHSKKRPDVTEDMTLLIEAKPMVESKEELMKFVRLCELAGALLYSRKPSHFCTKVRCLL